MSTTTLSQEPTPRKTYKELLNEVTRLRKQGGASAYKRAKLLVKIYNDQDFRDDHPDCDASRLGKALDRYVGDLCLTYHELAFLFEKHPKQSDWEEGNLRQMFEAAMTAQSLAEPKPIKRRRSATLAKEEELKTEVKQAEYRAKSAEKRTQEAVAAAKAATEKLSNVVRTVKSKDEQIAELTKQLAAANRRIRELEGECESLRSRLRKAA